MGYPFAELFPQLLRKDQSHEPFSKVIASALALSISHCVDPEVSLSRVGRLGRSGRVHNCIQVFSSRLRCEVVELNIQKEHIHLLVMVPPKVSISNLLGTVKGRTAIRVFRQFPYLKQKPYWGNHFWSPGYCVDTIGLDAEMIRAYVKYQDCLLYTSDAADE